MIRNVSWAALLVAVSYAIFQFIARTQDPAQAFTLRTPLDDAIPFVEWTVYLYSWVYTAMVYPCFVVRSQALFGRVVKAYAAVLVGSLVFFWFFPVTSLGFRPADHTLDVTDFEQWAIRLTFWVDPPYNLFPSLHMSIACIAALAAWKARRLYGLLSVPMVLSIAVGITTMKQHFIADGVAAFVLAAVCYRLFLHGYDPASEPREARIYGWRGLALYAAFHTAFYASIYVVYRVGVVPWA